MCVDMGVSVCKKVPACATVCMKDLYMRLSLRAWLWMSEWRFSV